MTLALQFVHSLALGYGVFGTSLAKGLREEGVELLDVELERQYTPDGVLPKTRHIVWASTPAQIDGKYEDQGCHVWTMWESMRLPESFRDNIEGFDTVIVPSRQNVELFSPFHPNVRRVPLGIDPDVWTPQRRTPPETFMDFLIVGAGPRKGTKMFNGAFLAAFPNWRRMTPMPRIISKNQKESFLGEHVVRYGARLELAELVGLYHSCHVYVQPSHGEGWGFQPQQALATGMPTVLSAIPAHVDYGDGVGGAIWVPVRAGPAGKFAYGDAGEWWVPDFDALVDQLRYVYDNWSKEHDAALEGSEIIRTQFSDRAMARGLIEVLGGHEELRLPYEGSGAWVGFRRRRFLVRVNRNFQADIAGLTHRFEIGRDYWESADTKRHLWDTGSLDASCIKGYDPTYGDVELGLSPAQVAELGGISAVSGTCGACRQPLNRTCPSCGVRVNEAPLLEAR